VAIMARVVLLLGMVIVVVVGRGCLVVLSLEPGGLDGVDVTKLLDVPRGLRSDRTGSLKLTV